MPPMVRQRRADRRKVRQGGRERHFLAGGDEDDGGTPPPRPCLDRRVPFWVSSEPLAAPETASVKATATIGAVKGATEREQAGEWEDEDEVEALAENLEAENEESGETTAQSSESEKMMRPVESCDSSFRVPENIRSIEQAEESSGGVPVPFWASSKPLTAAETTSENWSFCNTTREDDDDKEVEEVKVVDHSARMDESDEDESSADDEQDESASDFLAGDEEEEEDDDTSASANLRSRRLRREAGSADATHHEVASLSWDDRFAQLVEYREVYGHVNVPWGCVFNGGLADWVNRQRALRRRKREGLSSSLTDERETALDGLGLCWSTRDELWWRKFEELQKFKRAHGQVNFPLSYFPPALAAWVSKQRSNRKAKLEGQKAPPLTDEREAALERIGFRWVVPRRNNESWQAKLKALQAFKDRHGHADVPQRWGDGSLGSWVNQQRKFRKAKLRGEPSQLTDEREAALDRIGFRWQLSYSLRWEGQWRAKLEKLRAFKERHGTFDVPPSNRSLASWVACQRKYRRDKREGRRSRLTDEREKALDDLGFDWKE